jgi:Trk K+ transport system NAD-binding subunit
VLLKRAQDVVIPDGGTTVDAGDTLVVLADDRVLPTIRSAFAEEGRPSPPASTTVR